MTRTWLGALLLSSLATVAPARAEGPSAPVPAAPKAAKRLGKIPFRVVKLMPATQQALVYDRDHRTHVVVQVGDALGTFEVVDVDDDELVLSRDGREVVLGVDPSAPMPLAILIPAPHAPTQPAAATAPGPMDPYGPAPTAAPAPTVVPAPTAPAGPAPLDPYATPATATPAPAPIAPAAPAPLDPYAPAAPAPLDPYATAAPAPVPIAPAAPAPLDPYATATPAAPAPLDPYPATTRAASTDEAPGTVHEVLAPPEQRASLQTAEVLDPYAEPKVVAAPVGAKPVKGVPAPSSDAARELELRTDVIPLQRAELVAAVASFDKLAKQLGFELTGRGVRLRQVPADSYAYSLGLRSGDVISAIDGGPLRGLDDAAAVYVHLDSATRLSLDVERGTARGTLRFTLR